MQQSQHASKRRKQMNLVQTDTLHKFHQHNALGCHTQAACEG